ncbi:hypothetical protein LAZ67_9000414 [Cordylochernes scorpioides]|uniref:Uncharacterized protein n=1 Tax=Cordylochernes scorpioides TaxID=51811 RepID=A0ABY6KSG5_9ARAC|nr:hypothetical protein LAZ67_9000414 [Cordylochernes scorpioides]
MVEMSKFLLEKFNNHLLCEQLEGLWFSQAYISQGSQFMQAECMQATIKAVTGSDHLDMVTRGRLNGTCIKFCVKNEIKCADAFRMLTVAYGEATLDRSNVYRGYKMFSEGREDVNDEERAGRPSTSTTDEKINEVEKMILANRRITVREVAEDLNISIGSCHSIFIND